MATRSRIAVELPNGKVKSVYCHNDGYLEGVGRALKNMFPNGTDSKKVENYINEGDRSTTSLSYKEWRDENWPPKNHQSVESFFRGDIEEFGYLYTKDKKWIYQSVHGGGGPVACERNSIMMKEKDLTKKLDLLKDALPYYDLVNFKFKANEEYDKILIDWFSDCGELRAYYNKSTKSYIIKMVKGRVKIYVGSVFEGCLNRENKWVNEYLGYFRRNNKEVKLCPRRDLKTIEEIQNQEGVKEFTDDTIIYNDGSFERGNIFAQSALTINNIDGHKEKLNKILDSL